jgi:uncharacterized small protein (DUF1192 family)
MDEIIKTVGTLHLQIMMLQKENEELKRQLSDKRGKRNGANNEA